MDKEQIFSAAIKLADPAERAAFLHEVCRDDAELRAEIDALLKHDADAGSFLDRPAVAADATMAREQTVEPPGAVIGGRYKLLEAIGEGGMGTVWVAQQTEPVRRRVALKLVKLGMDSRQVLSRFEAERQALAVMDHPNIAKVLDGGVTDQGRPFFVMEYVKGLPITEYCDQARLTVQDRLKLFVQVCQAVQHAHQKGIIHRDLKPSNILVCLYDGQPVPKVIDFGLAKAIQQPLTEHSLYTAHGMMVGTPLYMSPEQAEFNNLDIDTRTDVYSLGVILYELLTGTTPLDRRRFKDAAWQEIVRLIKEEEPSKPSTKLSGGGSLPSVAAQRNLESAQLSRMVRGDLDWIVMKSLEKERSRRYETANGLARDIERYLHDDPVEARPPSAGYRFRKFARRNRVALATASVVLVALAAGTVISTWQAVRATRAERLAQTRLDSESQARAAEANQRKVAEDERSTAEKQRELAEANFQQARKAVDEYFTLVSESTLLDVPGLQPLRKDLLEAALRFYEGFATERTDDPAALADLAVTYMRVAEICHVTDRNDDAIAAIDKALDTIDRLRREFSHDKAHHRTLAGSWKGHRRAQSRTEMPKNPGAALASLVRLIDTMQALATENPDELRFRSDIAALCFRTGDLLETNQQIDAGVKYFERSKAILEELVRDQPNAPEHRADLARVYQYLGSSLTFISRGLEADEASRQALSLREQLVAESPNVPQHRADLVFSLVQCGSILTEREPAQADNLLKRARELAKSLVREYPGNMLHREQLMTAVAGRAAFAVSTGRQDTLKEAIGEFETLVAERPKDPQVRFAIANALKELAEKIPWRPETIGQKEELHRRSLALYSELANEFPEDSKYAEQTGHANRFLGWIARDNGRPDEALADFDTAAEVFSRLAEVASQDGYHRVYHADSLLQQVFILAAAGRHQEREEAVRRLITDYEKLATDFPDNRDYRTLLTRSYTKVIEVLLAQDMQAEAEEMIRKAIDEFDKLATARPAVPDYQRSRAIFQRQLAHLQALSKRTLEAEKSYLDAVNSYERIITQFPHYEDLWLVYVGLAQSLAASNRPREADEASRKAIELAPNNAGTLNESAWGCATSADPSARYASLAVELAKKAIELEPKNVQLPNTLGVAFYRVGNWQDAVEWLTKSTVLRNSGDSFDWYFLAMAHWQLGHKDEARKWYDKSVEWMEKNQPKNDELVRFRAEAEQLIRAAD